MNGLISTTKNMTQEEKQLLLKDLCARLPYGVKFHFYPGKDDKGKETIDTAISYDGDYQCVETNIEGFNVKNIKLYLRPMSSMSEKEQKEFDNFCVIDEKAWEGIGITGYINQAQIIGEAIDWLNTHYFDYRNLIEKGLALEAPEGMYKLK